jgi:hypothetical protein
VSTVIGRPSTGTVEVRTMTRTIKAQKAELDAMGVLVVDQADAEQVFAVLRKTSPRAIAWLSVDEELGRSVILRPGTATKLRRAVLDYAVDAFSRPKLPKGWRRSGGTRYVILSARA